MPGNIDSLLQAARDEWDHWGNTSWNLITSERHVGAHDGQREWAQYVKDTYSAVPRSRPSIEKIMSGDYAWSGDGMSFFFAKAGFTTEQFPFSGGHSKWIRKFIAARRAGEPALYWGYRLNASEATPQVGDLVGYARGAKDFKAAQKFFDKTRSYKSHTDLVVAKRPGEIDVIGANVLNSIGLKTVPLTDTGHIADRAYFEWFVVLRRRF